MKLRLTPEEPAYLTDQSKAAGMSRTDYIMAAAVQRCAEAQSEIVRVCDHWNMKLRNETEKEGE